MKTTVGMWCCLVLGLGGVPAAAGDDADVQPEPAAAEPAGDQSGSSAAVVQQAEKPSWSWWLHADEQYRLRVQRAPESSPDALTNPSAGDASDNDLRFYLAGGVRTPDDAFGAELALGLWVDADGVEPTGSTSGLGAIYDYRQPWWDFFTLQADYKSDGVLKLARVGRQASLHGLPVTFDGANLEVTAAGRYLEVFAFGGRSTYFFETRPQPYEEWIGSIGLVSRPLPELRLELDYRLELQDAETTNMPYTPTEEGPAGELVVPAKRDVRDHTYGLAAWYRHGEWLLLRARLRGLNDAMSQVAGAARLSWPGLDLGADLSLDAQLITLRRLAESLDPYFNILGKSLPNLRWRLDAWKRQQVSWADFDFHVGWAGRQVTDGEEDAFNQSFNRLYLQAQASDLFTEGLFVQLLVDGYFTHRGHRLTGDLNLAVGGAVGWSCKLLKAEIGSYYQQVKYEYYADVRVKNEIRTTYIDLAVTPWKWLKVRARYEYQVWDRDEHALFLTVSQSL